MMRQASSSSSPSFSGHGPSEKMAKEMADQTELMRKSLAGFEEMRQALKKETTGQPQNSEQRVVMIDSRINPGQQVGVTMEQIQAVLGLAEMANLARQQTPPPLAIQSKPRKGPDTALVEGQGHTSDDQEGAEDLKD